MSKNTYPEIEIFIAVTIYENYESKARRNLSVRVPMGSEHAIDVNILANQLAFQAQTDYRAEQEEAKE